ncbi:LysR family transcriptional regulator [Myxococcus sp. CA051A]|uniref:LysR substrate-binding domain-containing protein n=1 Tax=unclassified Myxococcus TaxID=2648731 RepID=UPI00157A2B9D|nr:MULTISPECIES: LysR substrate-binding domain-containing protein [unclassified Myxococcus]NTX10687.1 LysR family transcriptional regulator [Myxococcus sp. CA056]NTX41367.1 LysR family transcriptional regulator [Myxococcus sp. CA033]NTX50691.1 LysR family transcriptional regulator [Myxococcus sp. CA039A]NTX66022.1 LysR family transcriptional regulator [Myxococcus sp. CA051A]
MAFTPLNALNAFLAVARRRSFAAAAADLGVSSSSLSQSVRQLEARLGVALLTRTTRSVALTESGRRLMESAGPSVDQALAALKVAAAQPGEVTGLVKLTVPTVSVSHVVAPVLTRFLARHPRVEVELRVEDSMVDIVSEGLDGGIRFSESLERDMVQVRLSEGFRFVVVGSPAYFKRRGVPEKPRDLLTHDCLCIRSGTTGALYQWELERGARSWRVPVRGPLVTSNHHALMELAESGVGLMYAFEPEIADRVKRGVLRIALESYAAHVDGFFLYFPSRSHVSPAFRAFVDVAREVTSEPRASESRPSRTR